MNLLDMAARFLGYGCKALWMTVGLGQYECWAFWIRLRSCLAMVVFFIRVGRFLDIDLGSLDDMADFWDTADGWGAFWI